MKNYSKTSLITILTILFGIASLISVFAATSPALNSAWTFAILSSTYTNTTSTTVSGDIWYTTPPATPPILVTGSVHMADSLFSQAGIDQGTTLADLNSQVCTFTFAPWAIDLATDTTHSWAVWVYTPWVYCITWAATVWWTWITLDWAWTYIFKINWALNTVDNSVVTLSGASNCDVFWTPTAATTLGANTTFNWIIIDAAGITMWANTTFLWMALAYGWTVTTDTNTITAPICSSPATLNIIKNVVNWTAIASDFSLHVKYPLGSDVAGSPATWTWTPGTAYSLSAWNYIVSENANTSYTQSFAWDCNTSGNISLLAGDNKTCTITNTYITPVISWGGGGGGGGSSTIDSCPEWDYSYSYYDWICWTAPIVESTWTTITTESTWTILTTESTWAILIINPPVKPKVTQIIPIIRPTAVNDSINSVEKVVTPGFPDTWIHSENNNNPWNIIIIAGIIGILILISNSLVLNYKK